jgi:hypothetical protein
MSSKVCFVVKNIRYAEDVAGANCLPIIALEDEEAIASGAVGDACYYERNFIFPEQEEDDAFGLDEEELDHLICRLIMTQHEDPLRFNIISYDEVDIITTEEYEAILKKDFDTRNDGCKELVDGVWVIPASLHPDHEFDGWTENGVRRWTEHATM